MLLAAAAAAKSYPPLLPPRSADLTKFPPFCTDAGELPGLAACLVGKVCAETGRLLRSFTGIAAAARALDMDRAELTLRSADKW